MRHQHPSCHGDPEVAHPEPQHSSLGCVVLVVDDDHLVRSMVQLGLERSGCEVWPARSGNEAIALYRRWGKQIDLVLLDVCMPGLDGLQTLDALRQLNPDVLACFVTGDTGHYTPDDLRQHGAACVIAKPFKFEQLFDTIRLLVRPQPADEPLIGSFSSEHCRRR